MADITIAAPQRGSGEQSPFSFAAQSITLTWAWGVNPSPGALTYVSSSDYPQIVAGAFLEVSLFGRTFWGVAKEGPSVSAGLVIPTHQGSSGHQVRIDFADTRLYLGWDRVFGSFNNADRRIVNGQRVKHYWHILPEDYTRHHKTFTATPLTAAQILGSLLASPTVGSPWTTICHADQNLPYHNVVDCMQGRALNDVIQELCDFQGLTLTVSGGPWTLVFARKGDGPLPVFPANADDLRLSVALSEAPSRVFVVGDRNLYLCLNVPMESDWNRAWEDVFTVDLLAADLYDHEIDPRTGQRYNAMTSDPEHVRGWQLAKARALEITVRDYATLRRVRDGRDFSDSRKFGGRSRLTMPAALYLRGLVFRAFRPPATFMIEGTETPVGDLQLVDDQIAFVSHDVTTGVMTAHLTPPEGQVFAGGNGYAIARGYNLGSDLFQLVQPDRFNADDFLATTDLWQPITFSIDESGEGSQFIVFDDPVIRSSDLVTNVDGFAVLKANPTLTNPEVRAALTFAGPRFFHTHGVGSRDEVVPVSGLRREMLLTETTAVEVPYADGQLAGEKAAELATTVLARPWLYRSGGFRIAMADAELPPALSPAIGRLTLEQSAQGNFATVEFEQDRPLRHYRPESGLDREVRMQNLLPGQQELRAESHAHRLLATGLKQVPQAANTVRAYLEGRLGGDEALYPVTIAGGTGALPVGTPLWKEPGTLAAGIVGKTQAVMPVESTASHREFAGVVVRDGEQAGASPKLQKQGTFLARVKGPVAFGEGVGLSPGNDYLEKPARADEQALVVGVAEMAIGNSDIRLIPVLAGARSASTGRAVWG